MRHIMCEECNHDYSAPEENNAIYICPHCHTYADYICEYGYGPITPCSIFLGDTKIAKIKGCLSYHLESYILNINQDLQKGYKDLEVYKEAVDVIVKKLKL